MYSVTFLPDGATVEVAEGTSLLDAAAAAGVSIVNVCGGDGVCGKCRVIVKSGKVTAEPNMFLSRVDIQQGVALACTTYPDGDVVVEVPPESRIGGVPRLTSEDAIRYGRVTDQVGGGKPFRYCPLSRKQFLELGPPSADDNTSDQERVFRELRRAGCADVPIMQMGLSILRPLPALLREHDWQVTALLGWRNDTTEVVDIEPGDTSRANYGVAVDLGTTTVVAHLVDFRTSDTLATEAKYNSQAKIGEDVIARLMYASTPVRRNELRELMVGDVNELISGLILDAGIKLHDVTYVMCAGNTTMTHLLLGLDPSQIRLDPYVPAAALPPVVRAAEVGVSINPRGLLAALPSVSSYVGGDVLADVLVSGMTQTEDVSLLIDLGTNGELVLGNSDWLMCASASAGPAFEGGGISCGMRATTGALERIALGEGGRVDEYEVVGGVKPLGICGSGLIDVVGELLRVGCIDRTGNLIGDCCDGRVRTSEAGDREIVIFAAEETGAGRDIVISEADISNLIHTKGSIYMAAECLLDEVGLTFIDLANVYVAGGFGNYLKIDRAIGIGLLPDIPHEKFRFIGNGSVQGAKMAMLSEQAMTYVRERIAGAMTALELSTHHKYMNEYSSCLFLPHTDIERFPSVIARQAEGASAGEKKGDGSWLCESP